MKSFNIKREFQHMNPTLVKHDVRKKLIDACIAKEQRLIEDLTTRIDILTEVEGLGNEESYGSDNISSNSAKALEINALNNVLEFANNELDMLENLKRTKDVMRDRIALGAIVVTNHDTFFIASSLEKFFVDGKTYCSISPESPIYRAMEGKSEGEQFVFFGVKQTIKYIF